MRFFLSILGLQSLLILFSRQICGGQQFLNEMSDPSISEARSVTGAARQDQAHDMAVLEVNWAAAGTRPGDPIEDDSESTAILATAGICRNRSDCRYGNCIAER